MADFCASLPAILRIFNEGGLNSIACCKIPSQQAVTNLYLFAPLMFAIFAPVVHCAENQQHDPAFNAVCKAAIFTAASRTNRLI